MYKKITYPNGLRLITIPNMATKAATVFIFFGVGSRYESKEINGASHFIEHLMFKGTKKRPTSLDISKTLDGVGAEYNAMTAKDWTGYYIKINSKQIELAMDVLADMLYNSNFDNQEINKERGVIIEEINMYNDNPLFYIEDLLEGAIFEGSKLGWEIAGPKKVIREVSRKQLVDYKNKYYAPENTVIGVAGNINETKVKVLITKYFKTQLPKQTVANEGKARGFRPFVFDQNGPNVILKYKETEQVQLALGFPGYSYFDDRVYALYLLAIIMGGNMSSRLFLSVREKKGLAYSVRAYLNVYQDTGNIIIQAGLDKSRLEEAIKIIMNELKKVKKTGVEVEELKKAKEYLRGKIVLNLEDSSNLADWFAKQELLQNEIKTPEAKLKMFDQVTVAEVKQVANEAFQKQLINLAVIGPYKEKDYFRKLFLL